MLLAFLILPACSELPTEPAEPAANGAPTVAIDSRPSLVVIDKRAAIPPAKTASAPETDEAVARREIYFQEGSVSLDEPNRNKLQAHADYLKQNPKKRVWLIAYADSQGSRNYALALMERRLDALSILLKEMGIASSRIRRVLSGRKDQPKNCPAQPCQHKNGHIEIQFKR